MKLDNNEPYHEGKDESGPGSITYWHSTDNEEVYRKSIKDSERLYYLQKMGWTDEKSIEYKLNNTGLRGDDFTLDPCVLTLGCSYTFGVGLPEYSTWPRLVATSTKLKLANLSWPGTSADTAYRMIRYWIKRLNVKLVCFLMPPAARFELIFDPLFRPSQFWWPVHTYMAPDLANNWQSNDLVLNNWFGNEQNALLNQEKNLFAIKQICAERKVPLLFEDSLFLAKREPHDWARDFVHAGPVIHKKLSEKFVNDWSNL